MIKNSLEIQLKSYQKEGAAVTSTNEATSSLKTEKGTKYAPDLVLAIFEFSSPPDPRIDIGTVLEFYFVKGLQNPDNTKPIDAWKMDIYVENSSNGCTFSSLSDLQPATMQKCVATELGRELSQGDGYYATGGPKQTTVGQTF